MYTPGKGKAWLRGDNCRIYLAVGEGGKIPFAATCDKLKLKQKVRDKIEVKLQRIADHGTLLLDRTDFHQLEDPFYELKLRDGPGYRVVMYQHDDGWTVTHAFRKPPTKKRYRKETSRAANIKLTMEALRANPLKDDIDEEAP